MKKMFKKKRGLSLVELIISVALLSIVMVPVLTAFLNVAAMNNKTKAQIEINNIAKLVQQDVIDHVKKNDSVQTDSGNKNFKDISTNNFVTLTGVKIFSNSIEVKGFKYDATYISKTNPGDLGPEAYLINLYKNNKKVKQFKVYINVE